MAGVVLVPWRAQAVTLEAAVRAVLDRPESRRFSGVVLIARGDAPPLLVAHGVPPDARFVIGSVSKQMTAALILRAAEEGRLDLDAPLSAALPDLADDWAARVTVRQLLNHTSGVDARGAPLRASPGAGFSYSNGGYDLLGEVLEARLGRPLAAQFSALFAQCGMAGATTSGDPGADPVPGFAEAGDGRLEPVSLARQAGHVASGGVVAGAMDLLRWTQCLYGGQVLGAESLRAMTQPGATRAHRWGTLGYGYGLQLADTPLGVEYSHSGYVPGYVATLVHCPAARLTLVVLENTSWRSTDMGRAFHPHDALRRLLLDGAGVPAKK